MLGWFLSSLYFIFALWDLQYYLPMDHFLRIYFLMDLLFIGSIFYARWLKMTFFQNFLLSVNFLSEFFVDFCCWIFYINITSFWQSDFFFYTLFCLPQMFLYLFRSFVVCILAFENALFIEDSNFIILFWESIAIFDFLT